MRTRDGGPVEEDVAKGGAVVVRAGKAAITLSGGALGAQCLRPAHCFTHLLSLIYLVQRME